MELILKGFLVEMICAGRIEAMDLEMHCLGRGEINLMHILNTKSI